MKLSHLSPFDLPPAIVLRQELRPGDLGRIIQLHGLAYARACHFGPLFEADVAARLAEFVQSRGDGDRLWIAERAGRVVGCLAVVGLSPRDAQLRWFLIDPSVRGMGLGERLLREAAEFCTVRRYECVFLWTIRPSKATAEMYRAAGFEKVGEGCGLRWGVEMIEERYALQPGGRS